MYSTNQHVGDFFLSFFLFCFQISQIFTVSFSVPKTGQGMTNPHLQTYSFILGPFD